MRMVSGHLLDLGFGLHEDELPFAGEDFLQTSEILGFVVGEFKAGFVLHRSFTQVDSWKESNDDERGETVESWRELVSG